MLLMDAIQWEILRAFTHPSFQQYCEGAVAEYDAKNLGSKMCDKKCRTCVLRVLASTGRPRVGDGRVGIGINGQPDLTQSTDHGDRQASGPNARATTHFMLVHVPVP